MIHNNTYHNAIVQAIHELTLDYINKLKISRCIEVHKSKFQIATFAETIIIVHRGTYGSSRLRLRPLHPLVGLEATNATSTAKTAKQTILHNAKQKKISKPKKLFCLTA